LAIKLLM